MININSCLSLSVPCRIIANMKVEISILIGMFLVQHCVNVNKSRVEQAASLIVMLAWINYWPCHTRFLMSLSFV